MSAMPDEPELPEPRPGNGGPPGAGGSGQAESFDVRATRALELRMAGASYSQIAQALGWKSTASAHEAVQHALDQNRERVADVREAYRELQLARTERLIRGHWTKAIGGDTQATEQVRRLFERQARLLGLDAPVQVTVTDDTRARLAAMLDDLERRIMPGEVTDVHDERVGDPPADGDRPELGGT